MKVTTKIVSAARRRFRSYTGRTPKRGEIGVLTLTEQQIVVFIVGKCEGIEYSTVRDGKPERYYHDFKRRPVLAVSSDGKNAYLLAGGDKFTARGFDDKS